MKWLDNNHFQSSASGERYYKNISDELNTHSSRHAKLQSYHCDVESIEEVKGQRCDQIHKEPSGAVMEVDGAGVVHYLT